MTTEFEERMQQLHAAYKEFSPEERKYLLQQIKRNNFLLFRKTERIKHDLLRMEARRAQLSLDENSEELSQLEDKIIAKKTVFLKCLAEARTKCQGRQ
ncbi:hypothetical protein NRIC_06510 [Enterococcus florum]|uniref:DUF465 domain-containing protein n=1 Tax=Enterococcus florum TaxID=2480627 RepID=A0A4P5P512_9ENTE|nr:hypothetical protein [Enterococcus florum]GCF92760.1 hypothetical protein NRIC_06510 [Enterococcus florum]